MIVDKIIQQIKRKIFLLATRALLTAVKNSEKYMKVQVVGLKDDTRTDVERLQEYGFESYPKTDAEAFIISLNGNLDHGIAVCVADRRYRPTTLNEGEVMVYDYNGNYFKLKASDMIEIFSKGSVALQKMVLGETLKTTLESLIDAITTLTVTCAAPGNPSSKPINAAVFTAIKNNLSTILSQKVKNN